MITNPDGSHYYGPRQSLRRAFVAGFCSAFGVKYPRDYPDADNASSWERVRHAITRHELEAL